MSSLLQYCKEVWDYKKANNQCQKFEQSFNALQTKVKTKANLKDLVIMFS